MAKNNTIGKTKRSTDDMIDDAINRQNEWLENRRDFTRQFLRRLNVFAKPSTTPRRAVYAQSRTARVRGIFRAYWFPILCALVVVLIALWAVFFQRVTYHHIMTLSAPSVPEPIVRTVTHKITRPEFDVVRVAPNGNVVIAGRAHPNANVSIKINGKIVATINSDKNGEFVYSPNGAMRPGNYTVSLIDPERNAHSANRVFLYISPRGVENSMSLLMTDDGSRILQAPAILTDGDLNVSKIDYLDTGRIVVTGTAIPRTRVSIALNDKYLGMARVSDHKNFGIGANVGELQPGQKYVLTIRMHDGAGRTISQIGHGFIMPRATGNDNTFYTVRRGDCLWIIARNFMGRGTRFTIIAQNNGIKNPNLIYPRQKLRILTKGAHHERQTGNQKAFSK